MRAMWKGAVSFGLVTVPVKLYSATENHDLQFHQVRKSDGSRIQYKRVAAADGEEVAYGEIAKGYETPDGRTVVLTDEDLAALPNRSSREISVEKFVPAAQIDPILFDKSYYLEPDKAAVKPYALLREALRDSDRMAVVTISVRTRLTMAVLRVHEDVIVCQTLLWPDEVRQPDFDVLADVPEPKESETKMAKLLIDSMAEDFEPNEYEDDYKSAIEALVQTKIEGGQVQTPAAKEEDTGQVVDLLAALQRSVDRAKAARGEAGSGSGGGEADGEPARAGAAGDSDGGTAQDSAGGGDTSGAGEGDAKPTKKAAAKKTAAKKAPSTKAAAKKAG